MMGEGHRTGLNEINRVETELNTFYEEKIRTDHIQQVKCDRWFEYP
jgi:hypothetical protein